jgi:D-3-phosphoglycerate dehydrogenase
LGRIGEILKKYALSIGMNVISYDKKNRSEKIENVLKQSDIISLHITSSRENSGFFNKEKFDKMKDGAIFLNSSRPWLVNYQSLKWALDNKLSGVWFDFEIPFKHEKLITTPHLGGSTIESRKKSEMIIAKKLKKIYGRKSS